MQSTIKVIEEFVEAREGVSAWLEEEGGEEGEAVEMGAVVYASTEFWLRVHSFCVALSLEVAQGTSVDLRGRYEQELMEVLHALTTGRSSWGKGKHPGTAVEHNTRKEEESTKSEVKKEPTEDIVGDSLEEEEKGTDALPPEREALPSAVLGDTLALSHCPQALDALVTNDKVPLEELRRQLSGIDGNFYAMVHARLGVMVARHWLARFGTRSVCVPPPLNSMQQRTMEEVQARRAAAPEVTNVSGMPLDFIPDDHYYAEQLEQDEATLGEDEELYKEEVLDYYLHRAPQAAAAQSSAAASNVPQATMRRPQQAPRNGGVLLKPHHYAKVKEGFTWSQYNRTHYTKADPPPRKILWYEFTLRYPLLADTKRDMRRIFRIEDIPNKPEYCLLVFSVGPPYADVVYRIVRKQWDTRPGGVRTSFDSTGRYKLFFRFANTNYRR
ncbi:Cactus-binding C-terminus of cactin protein, putative [Angomonas deanei]|uniref:Cactus-binding C-terminus of cactin protein, putative n=1 Tax=Angomonas deanei TaxID=59799 RepID=A0A7G2CIA5_9TRYP|nr:Cactus-binding C-terminus of cactin protein, putative [Angomonas deanei]